MSVKWDKKRERFILDYYPKGGKGIRKRLTLPAVVRDPAVAEAIEYDLRHPYEHSELRADSKSTVNDLFPDYLVYYKDHHSITTHDNMLWTFGKYFGPILGEIRATELNKGHLSMYKRIRKEGKVKNRTVNKEMTYFMGFVNWCRKEQQLLMNDFKYERMKETKPEHVILSIDEAIRFILSSDPYYRVFFLTLYSLGLRFAEATGLNWEDLDPANKRIIARGKGGKERVLPVSDWLLYALNSAKPKDKKAEGLIFRSRITGSKLVNVQKAINRACKRAGIEKHVHPHLLRHTLATHFMAMKINIKIVQEWLGHSREDTTANMYMHAEMEHLRTAMDALNVHLDEQFTKQTFDKPETPVKRKYTVSEKVLEARRKAAPLARAAKSAKVTSIPTEGKKA